MTNHCGSLFRLIAASVLALLARPSMPCPIQCDCGGELGVSITMTCRRGPLEEIPEDVLQTQVLTIDGEERNDIRITYITDDSFNSYQELQELTIVFAGVKFIQSNAFANLDKLLRVDLKHNFIEYLDQNIFPAMAKLMFLDLSMNRIHRVHREMFAFPSLIMVGLANNGANLHDRFIFQNLSNVHLLDISGNDVGDEEPAVFHGVSRNLRVLRMNSCGIRTLEPEFVSTLTHLDSLELSDNNISEIEPGLLSKLVGLKELHLDRNDLTTIESAMFQNLDLLILSLGGNKISKIHADAFKYTNISRIVLSDNNITHIPANSFAPVGPTLRQLRLDGNAFNYVNSDTFAGITELEILDLSNSEIHGLSLKAFSGIKIRFLDMSGNSLMTLSEKAFEQFAEVTFLNISDNPWHCTCYIEPLINWLRHSNYSQKCSSQPNIRTLDYDVLRPFSNCLLCRTPSIYKGLTVVNLTTDQLVQCYYDESGAITLDQKVMISVGVVIAILVIGFVSYTIFKRRHRTEYKFASKTDIISNPGAGSRSGSRSASKADLTATTNEVATVDPNVKLENISIISEPSFSVETQNQINGVIYRNKVTSNGVPTPSKSIISLESYV